MTSERFRRLSELFLNARERPAGERGAFLDASCGGDVDLRREIEEMLAADEAPSGLTVPPFDAATAVAAVTPERIGQFRIVRTIGSGAMGVVHEAEQDSPRRRVALKLVKPELATESLRRRLEFEAEMLGRLKHPGIAQIYDAGAIDTSYGAIPYFAMELVEGTPLDEYLRAASATTAGRLDLFCAICDAVQHAHQQGVIHRDLKPANILVTGAGRPKIVDFGVARATDPSARVASLQTQAGQLVGTLQYMSPEQVAAEPDAIDIRSDVYALGVILHEMLAGEPPIHVLDVTLDEAVRRVKDDDPTPLARVDERYAGDVETIVLCALAKEKERRYASAAALAEDVRRYLRDEPIAARPATTFYQLAKFARRHRALVGAVAVVFAVTFAAFLVSFDRYRVAELRLEETERARANAETNLLVADRVIHTLGEMLSTPSDSEFVKQEVTLLAAVDRAARRLDEKGGSNPSDAWVHAILGRAFLGLDRPEEARRHLERSVDLLRPLDGWEARKAMTLVSLADARLSMGDLAGARAAAEYAVRLTDETDRNVPPLYADGSRQSALAALLTIVRTAGDFDAVDELCATILESAEESDLPAVKADAEATVAHTRGIVAMHRADYTTAADHFRREVEILDGGDIVVPERRLGALAGVVAALVYFRDPSAADASREILESVQRIKGRTHSETALAYSNHGSALRVLGRMDDADAAFHEALAIARQLGPEVSSLTAGILNNLGSLLAARQRYGEAIERLEEAVAMKRDLAPDGSAELAATLNNLGITKRDAGDLDGALAAHEEARDLMRLYLGEEHSHYAQEFDFIGSVLEAKGDLDGAVRERREALRRLIAYSDPWDYVALDVRNLLAGTLEKRGDPTSIDEAIRLLQECQERGTGVMSERELEDVARRLTELRAARTGG